jgi:ketosteroid isomerase-like protein
MRAPAPRPESLAVTDFVSVATDHPPTATIKGTEIVEPELQRLIDIEEIRRVIYRYFYAVDDGDIEGTLACFAEDVVQEWNGGITVLKGHEPMAEWLRKYTPIRIVQSHTASNIDVEVNGDEARSETRVLAFLVGDKLMELTGENGDAAVDESKPTIIRARGTGLTDDWVRTPDGWKIRHRLHRAFWQYEVEALDTVAEAKAVDRLMEGVSEK